MAVSPLCFFLMGPWVGLWPVIVVFPGNTNLFFVLFDQRSPKDTLLEHKNRMCQSEYKNLRHFELKDENISLETYKCGEQPYSLHSKLIIM